MVSLVAAMVLALVVVMVPLQAVMELPVVSLVAGTVAVLAQAVTVPLLLVTMDLPAASLVTAMVPAVVMAAGMAPLTPFIMNQQVTSLENTASLPTVTGG